TPAPPAFSCPPPTAESCSTTNSASSAAPAIRSATPTARSPGATRTVVMALSTGVAEAGQRLIVAALGWSWQSATVDRLTGELGVGPRAGGASPADCAALEYALRLAERWRALVIAATVGPPAADALLRTALAAGAAGALRVEHAGRADG